ncbi:MAG: prepilin-type N-terminal cleavage/methylation domain-containing protein [Lachnospiraceae bacterium]|nr:prepilin-type N-terminal cleavage/methylation domain-containing protein [Lachnospiraceae bacterium]
MRQRNEGFSLIELIVVIAIMTVLTVGLVMGLSSVFHMEEKKTVETICGKLNYTQNSAMAKSFAYIAIERESDGYYITLVEGRGERQRKEHKRLCSLETTISYTTSNDGNVQEIDETHPLALTYQKTSGAFAPMIDHIEENDTFVFVSYQDEEGTARDCYCTGIVVTRDDRSSSIVLYPKTGKCEQEQ